MRLSRSAMGLLLGGVLLAQTNAASQAADAAKKWSDWSSWPLQILSDTTDTTEKGPSDESSSGPLQVLTDTMGIDFNPYLKEMLRNVKQHWYALIPESASIKRGKVVLEFRILKDGSVAGLRVAGSSGDIALDRPAYGSITGSNPFPPLPKEFSGPYLGLRFNYYYNMDVPQKPRLSIRPVESTIATGSTVQFWAFEYDKNAAVTWSIIACGDACGTISSAGLYTAPPKIPNPSKVTIRATVVLIPDDIAEATVKVVGPKP